MYDEKEFSAGRANMQPRDEVPFTEDPRAMFRAAAGALGGYGMGQAGLGMLGGAARGYNSLPAVERMFSPGGIGAGMLSALGVGSAAAGQDKPNTNWQQELRDIENRRANASKMTPEEQMKDHLRRIQILREQGLPVQYQRNFNVSEAPGMIFARAPAPRPTGAGDRRDKRLRDAEDADVKTS